MSSLASTMPELSTAAAAVPPRSPSRGGRRLSTPLPDRPVVPVRSPNRPRTSEGCARPRADSFSGGLSLSPRPRTPQQPQTSESLKPRSPQPPYARPATSMSLGSSRSTTVSPATSPRPPSSPPNRSGSRRYDLKPPVPSANVAYQANNTPQLRNAALLARINQMRLAEAPATVESIMQANDSEEGIGELPYLCEVFHQRIAELFSNVQLAQLSQAADLMFQLIDQAELLPNLKPAAQLNEILEGRLNSFIHHSTRMLESRVDNCLKTNKVAEGGMKGELDHFLKCFQQSQLLARYGITSLKSQKKSLEHLLRIIDSAPLVDLQQRASELVGEERVVEDALLARLRRVSFRGTSFTDFKALPTAMVELHQKLHIQLFDRVVEKTMCEEIPIMVKTWPLDRLQQECENQAGMLTLAGGSDRIWEVVNAEVGNRLLGWVCEIVTAFRQTHCLDRTQADLSAWKKAAQRGISAGLVVFGPAAREQVISAFSRCYDECVSNNDFLHAEEIDRLLFQVGILMGADRRLNPAALRQAGSISASGPPAGANRNLPPLIRVTGCH